MLAFTRNAPCPRPRSRAARLALLAAPAAFWTCVDQPDPVCITTTSAFAVKLIEVGRVESAPGACDGLGPAGFNALPEVGISPYYGRKGPNGQPDYDRGSLALQSAEMGTFVYTARSLGVENDPAGQLYSRGDFSSSRPDEDNFCTVPTLSPTRVVLPDIDAVMDDPATADVDESFPGQPAVDATLEWSNLRVYVTADTFGTQMDADLVDTRVTAAGSCAISYRALGLAPAVSCAALDPETGAPLTNPDGSYQLDPVACEPEADPAAGRVLGSGISPSTRFSCDPATAFCMIEGDTIPALR